MKQVYNTKNVISTFSILSLNLIFQCSQFAIAYPFVIDLVKGKEKCFRFNIRDDDDARAQVIVVPQADASSVDQYIETMRNLDGKELVFPQLPEDQRKTLTRYGEKTGVFVRVKKNPRPIIRHQPLKSHIGVIFREMNVAGKKSESWEVTEYDFCLYPSSNVNPVKVIFNFVFESDEEEEYDPNDDDEEKKIVKKEQLRPLERGLQQAINKGNRILNELRYMERRESRMNQTSMTINRRVRHISYFGIALMFFLSLFQMKYLKSYLKKKKIL